MRVVAENKPEPCALPPGVVGGKRRVYEALCAMANDQRTTPHEVYFRKADLADKSGLSISRITPNLHWLQDQQYLTYTPGDPGMLSHVVFTLSDDGEDR